MPSWLGWLISSSACYLCENLSASISDLPAAAASISSRDGRSRTIKCAGVHRPGGQGRREGLVNPYSPLRTSSPFHASRTHLRPSRDERTFGLLTHFQNPHVVPAQPQLNPEGVGKDQAALGVSITRPARTSRRRHMAFMISASVMRHRLSACRSSAASPARYARPPPGNAFRNPASVAQVNVPTAGLHFVGHRAAAFA